MNDQELLKRARECSTISGDCTGCPFDGDLDPDGDSCAVRLVRALAQRVENLGVHSARSAELLAVRQERERWIPVVEKMPEVMEWVLCRCQDGHVRVLRYDSVMDEFDFTVIHGHGYAFPRGIVTHWKPLPEGPEEVERGTTDI